jgi:hypothetical protein
MTRFQTSYILVELPIFTCGTVFVPLFDIAGCAEQSWTATSTGDMFIMKMKDSMPDRGPSASRMAVKEGVEIHRMRQKPKKIPPKPVTIKDGHQLAFHQGETEGR